MFLERLMEELRQALSEIEIGTGDILYVASDIKTFLFYLAAEHHVKSKSEREKALHALTDAFQEVVTERGTLLFPVFSWDWCRGNGFDCRQTKGETGTLSNWILANRNDFVRTRHPIYSFMVWGRDAEYLKAMDNQDAWSRTSPFYYLHKHGAKELLLHIEAYQGLTFGHYVEQEAGVPYRHPKFFFGDYTDENGSTETRMYSMYVRDMDVEVGCGICNQWLIEHGVAKQTMWMDNTLTVVDLAQSYPIIRKDMLENAGGDTLKFSRGALNWSDSQTVPYEVKGITI